MTLKETGEIFFGFTLYFNGNFDFVKEQYKIPGYLQKQAIQYTRSHEHTLLKYRQFGKRTIIVFALLNQLKYRMGYQINDEMNNSDSIWFFDIITTYPEYFRKDVEFLVNNMIEPFDVYGFYIKKQITWFTMPYVFGLLNFDKEELLKNDLIVHEMKYLTKALKVFRFNSELLKDIIQPLQKKFDLRS